VEFDLDAVTQLVEQRIVEFGEGRKLSEEISDFWERHHGHSI
jgi:hypothetical protein